MRYPGDPGPARPPSRLGQWARRHALLLGIAAAMLYVFPYFPGIRSANELPRVYLVQAMVEDGSFAIDSGVARYGTTVDVSCAHAPKGTSLEQCRAKGGHFYSNKAPGSSMLAVPGYMVLKGATAMLGRPPTLAEVTWVCRVTTGVLPTLGLLWLLLGFLRRFVPDAPGGDDGAAAAVRRTTVVAYALGSMALTYSLLFISHQVSAVCIAAAWILLIQGLDGERGPRALVLAGVLAGAAPLCDYQAAFAGVPVTIWLAWQLVAQRRRDWWQVLGRLLLGAVGPIAVLLLYHAACFGGPLRTGYDASTTFAHFHQQGFLGITELRAEALAGSTISGDNGLITLAPWLLLALPGLVLMAWRRGPMRGHAVTIAGVALAYLLFISSINFWRGGWQLGPRYITAMLPFLLPPVAVALAAVDARWWARGLAWGTILVGVAIYAGSAGVFPHFPEAFGNPVHDLVLRLLRDGDAGPTALALAGVHGAWALLPYGLIVAGVLGAVLLRGPDRRQRLMSLGVALVVAIVVLIGYRAFPHGGRAADRAYQFVRTTMPR